MGTSSDPWLEGRCGGGGAPSARLAPCRRLCVAEGLGCNFLLCWVSFCNFLALILSVYLAKKKATRHLSRFKTLRHTIVFLEKRI
jgi:hypothetical protein